ncbi:MAG: FtsW/RodA/SpoVE family cell cycle protein, partial [Bacteroidota bacterium]
MNDYRLRRIDWVTISLYLALVGLGWLTIYTVTYEGQTMETAEQFFKIPAGKQFIWIGISLVTTAVILLLDWKIWRTFAYTIYAFALILLVAVLFLGKEINGATSWFSFGSFAF